MAEESYNKMAVGSPGWKEGKSQASQTRGLLFLFVCLFYFFQEQKQTIASGMLESEA